MPHGTRLTHPPKGTFLRRGINGDATSTTAHGRARIGYRPVVFIYNR
jgi:hypothetical protein